MVGLFFGLPGILLGPFIGAVIGELTAQRGLGEAGRAGVGATIGLVLGAAGKLALGLLDAGGVRNGADSVGRGLAAHSRGFHDASLPRGHLGSSSLQRMLTGDRLEPRGFEEGFG